MSEQVSPARKPLLVRPGQGRRYSKWFARNPPGEIPPDIPGKR